MIRGTRTDQNHQEGFKGFAFPLLGLFGEVGTLASALKKRQRDRDSYLRYTEDVLEEFGDVLWYFTNLATRASLRLSNIAQAALQADKASNGDHTTFASIQATSTSNASLDSKEFEKAVIKLSGQVGLLLNDFSLGKLESKTHLVSTYLTGIFGALVSAARAAGVSLHETAKANLSKINSRWPLRREYSDLFDDAFDEIERLPRRVEMQIIENEVAGKTYVIQRCNDINIGSRLTGNKVSADDYRFHDVFHLGYAAILGWSPVIRALFKP